MSKWKEIQDKTYEKVAGDMWLALKDGRVVRGFYWWQQGRYPVGFNTDEGRIQLDDVSHYQTFIVPTHPDKE